MTNKIIGLFLIALSLLTAVIAYGFNQVSTAVKESAAFMEAGVTLTTSKPSVPVVSIILIVISIVIGIIIISVDKK